MTDHDFKQKRAMLAQFWKDQTSAYGSLWTKEGDITSERFGYWLDNVRGFKVEYIREGILLARKRTEKFPPTLPEFRGMIESFVPYTAPQNVTDDFKQETERAGRRLLAGKSGNEGNRIIKRDEQYVHQVKRDGEWHDADWQQNHPDGLLPVHK